MVCGSVRNCAVVHIRRRAKEENTAGSARSSGPSAAVGARRRTDGQEGVAGILDGGGDGVVKGGGSDLFVGVLHSLLRSARLVLFYSAVS